MAVVCRPAVALPEHPVTREDVLRLVPEVFRGHPRLSTILRIVRNSGIERRYFVQDAETTIRHPGFERRNSLYEKEAKRLGEVAVSEALRDADVNAREIDLIVATSCTGFMIPSLDAHLINRLDFRSDVRRLPVAQLGCSAGAASVGRALDFLKAYPEGNVLVVAVELCSLCFQPQDHSLPAVVSAMLFGDGVAATVVRGREDRAGFVVEAAASRFLRDTEHFMGFEVRDSGFHIILDRAVPSAVEEEIVPAFREFAGRQGFEVGESDFFVIHPGGARVISELARCLDLNGELDASRDALREVGNLSSASVFFVLRNTFDRYRPRSGDRGFMAAFGPGFSIEMVTGRWSEA